MLGNWQNNEVHGRKTAWRELEGLASCVINSADNELYFGVDSSRPRYFNIAFVFGGAPRHSSYILARSSVLPFDKTMLRKRSPLARVSSPCSTNHWKASSASICVHK